MLDIPVSSLRRYSVEFQQFLSAGAQSNEAGRKRVYTPEDVITLETVKRLLDQGFRIEEIKRQFERQGGANVIDQEPGTQQGDQEPGQDQVTALALPGLVKQIARLQETYKSQKKQIDELESARAADRQQIDELKQRLDELAGQLEEQRRPILDKLRERFKRKPPEGE